MPDTERAFPEPPRLWPLDIAARPTPRILRTVIEEGCDDLNGWWEHVVTALLDEREQYQECIRGLIIRLGDSMEHHVPHQSVAQWMGWSR